VLGLTKLWEERELSESMQRKHSGSNYRGGQNHRRSYYEKGRNKTKRKSDKNKQQWKDEAVDPAERGRILVQEKFVLLRNAPPVTVLIL